MKRKRISRRSPEDIEADRILHERLEARISQIERETGSPRDRWTLAERIEMIEAELAAKREIA